MPGSSGTSPMVLLCLTLSQLAYSCNVPNDSFLLRSTATPFRMPCAAPIKDLKKLGLFFSGCVFHPLSFPFSESQWRKVQDRSALIRMLGVSVLNHAWFRLVKAVWTLARKQRQVLKTKVTFTSNIMMIDAFLTLSSQVHHSSRENKGSGGQVAQLQTLERLRAQASHRTLRMDVATANEPLNPMAPSTRTSTSCGSRTSGTVE